MTQVSQISVNNSPIQVALFPIPNMVTFPGNVVPLHVFEPRYRQMVHDSIEADRMIGVCHTRKEIHPAPDRQDLEDALHSNQSTYLPHEIFSAGPCEIVETLDDGRIHARIDMVDRYRTVVETQTLPYRIVEVETVRDDVEEVDDENLPEQVYQQLGRLLKAQNPALKDALQTEWAQLTTAEFSFRIFQVLRFDADLMQEILEMRSVQDRLRIVDEILSSLEEQ